MENITCGAYDAREDQFFKIKIVNKILSIKYQKRTF